MLTFYCPACRAVYEADEEDAGTLYTCECGEPLRVPDADAAPKPPRIRKRTPRLKAELVDESSEPKKTVQVVGIGESLARGFGIGVMCFGIGFLLLFCFWPVGVLFMLVGLVMPLISLVGDILRGPCPYCGHEVRVPDGQPGVNCPACSKRILVREQDFVRID
ncbi:MAG: hypothetical protein K8U57_18535 [Planctomycetes bacterium]|nr:hypothetical protein [Planctomycetota bacterium]